ncbi:MAG: hypothetical protein SXU28_10735 [Pseudomonadota bacterium]|nr:hypothetical protein [Pseudomonadota bacterium]
MSMLEKIQTLRAEALEEAMASPAFETVRALDAAVVSAGGKSLLEAAKESKPKSEPALITRVVTGMTLPAKKMSQGDAAELALREKGPLPVGRLQEAAEQKGAVFRGDNPVPSFRSMLSKDARFRSVQRNNMYFWWLKGVELPREFMPEPTSIDDLLGSGSNANEEGGDANAATMPSL